jgi:diguanylate cyclase (GGDEF)-like protein
MADRILVVDDEETLRTVISQVLLEDGHDVTTAASGEEAVDRFRQSPYPLVLTDIVMGKMSGLDLLKEVKLINPDSLVVVMTSHASLDSATSALRAGAYDYLTKPFEDLDQISMVVNRAMEQVRLIDENHGLMEGLRKSTEELERVNRNLKEMADRDGLTTLYNHRYFRKALGKEMARAHRHERTFSLVFIDVDHFKKYNDTHGHLAGDEVLTGLARLLKEGSRAESVVARYGGEEFVVLLPETDKNGARTFAESMRTKIEEYPFKGRETQPLGKVTVSMGVAAFPDDAKDENTLIDKADEALYEAKQSGRNTVRG